jgi:hypothetical protein
MPAMQRYLWISTHQNTYQETAGSRVEQRPMGFPCLWYTQAEKPQQKAKVLRSELGY